MCTGTPSDVVDVVGPTNQPIVPMETLLLVLPPRVAICGRKHLKTSSLSPAHPQAGKGILVVLQPVFFLLLINREPHSYTNERLAVRPVDASHGAAERSTTAGIGAVGADSTWIE